MSIIDDAVSTYKKEGTITGAAKTMHVSPQKMRKLLITAGAIQPEMSRKIMFYLSRGFEKEEIAKKLETSIKNVEAYLPYSRMPYNQPTRSKNAERIEKCRKKKLSLSDNEGVD